MSIDNENDEMDAENPGNAGVATAPSMDDLDAAMAALIRAASPSESTQAQSSMEPARSGPAMALVNSVSIMDEDDDDFFDDDDDETEEAQDQSPAPAARQASPPAPIPFRAPQAQTQEPAPQMQYTPPPQVQQPAPVQMEYQQPLYTPQPQAQPAAEYVAPQPVAQPEPQAPAMAAPVAPIQQQVQQQPAMAPQAVQYQQPVAPAPAAPVQNVTQHARATLMHETNQDKHLHDASRYIRRWLEENTNDEEVIEAAMDWARKHKTAEHNGHVIASLLVLDSADNEVTVMAVRWLTHHSMHQLAPEVVAGLTRRQQQ